MLSIFALRPYFLRVCIDVLQSQNFLGTWDSWELQQEHFPDLNSVQIDTRQADRKRERKEEGKKVVCLKSHVTGKAVLRNRSSNCLCKASSILQPIKWIFKLIQLNRKQNKRVYNISAVTYAGQETFRAYWVLLKEVEIQCIYPSSEEPFQGIWMDYVSNFHLFSTSCSYASYIFNFCLLSTGELAANQWYN